MALAIIFTALTCVFACPAQAQASECYVKDASGNVTYYDHFEEGKKAAYGTDKVLVLTSDINTSTTIGIDGGQELTIDMSGFKVCYSGGHTTRSCFHLYPNSSLTLTSSVRDVSMTSFLFLPGRSNFYDHDEGRQEGHTLDRRRKRGRSPRGASRRLGNLPGRRAGFSPPALNASPEAPHSAPSASRKPTIRPAGLFLALGTSPTATASQFSAI